jgi:hypothetical protein
MIHWGASELYPQNYQVEKAGYGLENVWREVVRIEEKD